jgi:adenosylhomocysteine nucleosidase
VNDLASGSCRPAPFAVVVIVSADAEWRVVRSLFPDAEAVPTPLGEWLTVTFPVSVNRNPVVFFHGGWGKIAAAASAQYAIDRWRPDLLLNLGTCGGFAGQIAVGEVVLAERTVVYDIVEQMGDPDEAVAHFTTVVDLEWLGDDHPHPVRRTVLVSGDRDLAPAELQNLATRFGAVAGDWESGAIAWVAARHGVPCVILRGVTDLVSDTQGDAYDGNHAVWQDATEGVMRSLIEQAPAWIARAMPRHSRVGAPGRT